METAFLSVINTIMYNIDQSGNLFQAISKRRGTATLKKKQAAFFAPFYSLRVSINIKFLNLSDCLSNFPNARLP